MFLALRLFIAMNRPPIKLTPSMLTFLWDECRRCFWLHARGLPRPRMPFPSVFARYHDVLTRYCLGRSPSTLDAALPPGRFVGGELWVKSRTLELDGVSFFLRGRLDHLAQFDDGAWGIIDFKTMRPQPAQTAKYARQLHAYAWALERAAPDALCRTPIRRMGLFCLDPVAVTAKEDAAVWAELRPHWVEVERDDDAFETFLRYALAVLTRPLPPPASQDCPCCTYTGRRRALARSLA